MIVISRNLTLGHNTGANDTSIDSPVIGYENLVTASNVSTTTADTEFPATNLANPATYNRWLAADNGSPLSGNAEYVTIAVNRVDPIDYVAIARHNLGTAAVEVSVEGSTDGSTWTELVQGVLLPDDGPMLFRFDPTSLASVRLKLLPGTDLPTIAVVYTGKLLVLQRRLYVGHTPIKYGRSTKITNGRSESGAFLGRIQLGESVGTTVALKNLTPGWYRTYFDPFVVNSKTRPFFFAWRPGAYPYETGYAWLTNDAQPSNQLGNGMMGVTLRMSGVV